MGDEKKTVAKSRRWFLSLLSPGDKKEGNPEMVKMLTADGKVVEIKKSVLDAATKNQKSSNKEIYDWMKNPSKENNC
jgi:23S rRNA A1618 N6-methylase RlmF